MKHVKLIILYLLFLSSPVYASFSFSDFSGTPAIVTNRESAVISNKLRMTNAASNGRNWWEATAFYSSKVPLNANKAFSTAFSFETLSPDGNGSKGGDGFTFVLHNDGAGLTAMGGAGNNLGLSGINHSAAVEFDWLSGGGADLAYAHIGINVGGNVNSMAQTIADPVAYDFSDGNIWYAWIDYDGTTMEARVSQTDSRPASADVSYAFNLNTALNNPTPSEAYVGFTGGTGGSSMILNILGWKFNDNYAPIASLSVTNPNLTITLDNAVYDPAVENRKAVPGEDMLHSATVVNTGGPVDADALAIVLDIPNPLSFKVGSITFTDAVGGGASGLTCCYSVEYSSTAGPAYTWTTTAPTGTYNANVRGLRLIPSGAMNDGSSSATGFKFTYQTQIQ